MYNEKSLFTDTSIALNVRGNPQLRKQNQDRDHCMRKIGVFELIDGEYHGTIATFNFKSKAIIRDNPYKTCHAEPDYIIMQQDAELFHHEMGFAWEKHTAAMSKQYLAIQIDDPSFSKTVCAVLIKGSKNMYNLFWDRVGINDDDIEKQFISEELIPYTGVLRRIDKPTPYLLQIYPLFAEQINMELD